MSDDEEWGEEATYFEGACTCTHDSDDHGWGECGVDGCPCEAGWVE